MMSDLFSSLDIGNMWACKFVFLVVLLGMNRTWLLNSYKIMVQSINNSLSLIPFPSLILFAVLFVLNALGLVPFVASVTSSLWVCFSMAFIFWGLLIFCNLVTHPKGTLASLMPIGAPMALAPMLVLLETISLFIRPITLTIRVIANISAGHIVLSLLSYNISVTNFYVGFALLGFSMFEVFVAVIQAYIFSLLIMLYSKE